MNVSARLTQEFFLLILSLVFVHFLHISKALVSVCLLLSSFPSSVVLVCYP